MTRTDVKLKQQQHLHTSLQLFTQETRLRNEWVLTSSVHSGSCTWSLSSLAVWRLYMRTLRCQSSVIQLPTITQILIFTKTVLVLRLGGNYIWKNIHAKYFVEIIRILWQRPQRDVRSITVSWSHSNKQYFVSLPDWLGRDALWI